MARSAAPGAVRWSTSALTADEFERVRCAGGRRAVLALLVGLGAALGAEADRLFADGADQDVEAATRLTFLVSDVLDCHDDLDPS